MMRTLPLTLALLAATPALAKPWYGIEPGSSTREDVVKKFGEPTKVLQVGGKDMLTYYDKEAIKGAKQAQFRIDPETKQVERIDIFPGPVIDKDSVENTYGPQCASAATAQTEPCYQKKVTDEFRTYFQYPQLGVVVFFNEDAKTVNSFQYSPPKPPPPVQTRGSRSSKSSAKSP